MPVCSACSHHLRQDARFCDNCGARVTPPPTKSKIPNTTHIPSHSSTHHSPTRSQPSLPHLSALTLAASSDPGLDELKALVSRELTSAGILTKLQAQLRAHIYTTLAAHSQPGHPLPVVLPATYHSSIEGTLVLGMVQEYCMFHGLYNTLSVLQLEAGLARPAPAVDRAAIARSLHISSSSAASSHHSLAYELYRLSHTSRPSSPLVSPRSEPHPLPLSHHISSPSRTTEDLTPPILLSPTHSNTKDRLEEEDVRRLREVEAQLAAMRAGKAVGGGGGGGGDGEEYSEDWTGVSLDGSGGGGGVEDVVGGGDVYGGDEVVLDGEKWAKRYDYVEAVQRPR